jgi:hypothetical protein
MTAKTNTPAAAETSAPVVLGPMTEVEALRAELEALRAAVPAKPARPTTARDYVKSVDLAIIIAAGEAVEELVPEQFRKDVRQLVANQLHHLSTPKAGWPSTTLPTPDRSEWR